MTRLTESQLRNRDRAEGVIRLLAPALDLLLAAGDRISRVVERDELDWTPPRPLGADRDTRLVGPGAPPK